MGIRRVIAALLTVLSILATGLLNAAPAEAAKQRHAGVVIINQIPRGNPWFAPVVRAVSRLDYHVKGYRFRSAPACPTRTTRYKCIYLRVDRLPAGIGAQTQNINGGVHCDWWVQFNTRYTGRFTADQKWKIGLHELAHAFGLQHVRQPRSIMYYDVMPNGYAQRFFPGQRRYLNRYVNY